VRVVLDRLAVVSAPERSEWATVVARSSAIDVVLVCPPQRWRWATLAGSPPARKAVVLLDRRATSSLTVDVRCTVSEAQWSGVDRGAGHLKSRQ
jgi:hypothetical protein